MSPLKFVSEFLKLVKMMCKSLSIDHARAYRECPFLPAVPILHKIEPDFGVRGHFRAAMYSQAESNAMLLFSAFSWRPLEDAIAVPQYECYGKHTFLETSISLNWLRIRQT